MEGKFITKEQVLREKPEWGALGWVSSPHTTNAKDLVVIEVSLAPGNGHNFHHHPNQEEVIYVIEGEVEQWIGQESKMLTAGDVVFIPPAMVHATFNVSSQHAKLLAILGPTVGDGQGYEIVEVFEESPWKDLR